jgi:hypothetical protein
VVNAIEQGYQTSSTIGVDDYLRLETSEAKGDKHKH